MTLDEVKAKILANKLRCFKMCRTATNATETELSHMGQRKGAGEACLQYVRETAKEIGKLIRAWERANPDKD